jgi:hypothetical protein
MLYFIKPDSLEMSWYHILVICPGKTNFSEMTNTITATCWFRGVVGRCRGSLPSQARKLAHEAAK